jgi:hypothetical protein
VLDEEERLSEKRFQELKEGEVVTGTRQPG